MKRERGEQYWHYLNANFSRSDIWDVQPVLNLAKQRIGGATILRRDSKSQYHALSEALAYTSTPRAGVNENSREKTPNFP